MKKFNVSLNDIPYAKEERIQRDIFSLESRRSSFFHKKEEGYQDSVKQVEVELCYLQRELEIRKNRKLAHIAFLAKHGRNNKNNKSRVNRARRR